MRPSQALTALWAFAAVSTGFMADDDQDFDGEGFSLDQEDVSNGTYWHHPSIDMHETYLKFNGTPPDDVVYAANAARKGSIRNFPGAISSFYLIPARIGSPPQRLNLDFDTGSSDLWVYSSVSPKRISKGHATYKPKRSRTSRKVRGAKWNIRYGDGSSAGGTVYRDVVRLGPVAIRRQGVEAAKRVGGSFGRQRAIDGIFGAGFTVGNTVRPRKEQVFFDNVKLKHKVFCARLNKGVPGSYDIGFINHKKHSGPVHYTKVSRARGYWQFRTQGYKVGANGNHQPTNFNAIADTGTSVTYIPFSAIKKFYHPVHSAQYNNQVGGIIYACSENLPSFSIFIGGARRVIAAKYLNAGFVGTLNGRRFCFGGLQANTGLGGLSILGDTFLQSQYVVFDYGKTRIGFADK